MSVTEHWADGAYRLDLAQATPPTPGQPEKAPLVIPVAYGLIDPAGATVAEGVLELTEAAQSFEWELPARPVPSLLRGFSAPVILERETTPAERAFLLARDTDPFNKWEAGHAYGLALLARLAEDAAARPDPEFLAALAAVAADGGLDPAFKALLLGLPSEDEVIAHMAAAGRVPDPLAIWRARRRLEAAVADALAGEAAALYAAERRAGALQPGRGRRGPPGTAGAGAGAR